MIIWKNVQKIQNILLKILVIILYIWFGLYIIDAVMYLLSKMVSFTSENKQEKQDKDIPMTEEQLKKMENALDSNRKLLKEVNTFMDLGKYRVAIGKLKDFIPMDNEEINREISIIREKFLGANLDEEELHGFDWRLTCLIRENPNNPDFLLMKRAYFDAFTKTEIYKKEFASKKIGLYYDGDVDDPELLKLVGHYSKEEFCKCHYEYASWLKGLGYNDIAWNALDRVINMGILNNDILKLKQELENEESSLDNTLQNNLTESNQTNGLKKNNKKINLQNCNKEDLLTIDGFDSNKADNFISDRDKGKIYYDMEIFANIFGLQPHQMLDIQDRIIFPKKPNVKQGRKLDF